MNTLRLALISALALAPGGAHAQSLTSSASARPSGFMVPAMVVLRATTKAEESAHAVWTLRAALNVAALQCQFSPFMRTVKNYNDVLRHHSREFTQAQTVMMGHFGRYDKARARNSFDQYTTRTYNSFSTLDAQYAFCESASVIGRDVLRLSRNSLGQSAPLLNSMIRQSLAEPPERILFKADDISLPIIAALPEAEPEDDRKKRRRRRGQ